MVSCPYAEEPSDCGLKFPAVAHHFEIIFNPETVNILKENSTENIRIHKRKTVMENQNQ
jgi:hypothetical protein